MTALALALLFVGLAIGAALHANRRAGAWAARYHDETQRTIAHERARNARLEALLEEIDSTRLGLTAPAQRTIAPLAAPDAAPRAPRLIPELARWLEGLDDEDRQEYLETIDMELERNPDLDQRALLARLDDPNFG